MKFKVGDIIVFDIYAIKNTSHLIEIVECFPILRKYKSRSYVYNSHDIDRYYRLVNELEILLYVSDDTLAKYDSLSLRTKRL